MSLDRKTEWKWDLAAERLDSLYACGPEKRWEPIKEKLFARMGSGRILFVAVGTGLDIAVSREVKILMRLPDFRCSRSWKGVNC